MSQARKIFLWLIFLLVSIFSLGVLAQDEGCEKRDYNGKLDEHLEKFAEEYMPEVSSIMKSNSGTNLEDKEKPLDMSNTKKDELDKEDFLEEDRGPNKEKVTEILNQGPFALICTTPYELVFDPEFTDDLARERFLKMGSFLSKGGYKHYQVEGQYEGVQNSYSYLIMGISRDLAKGLGEIFEQDSIIFSQDQMNYFDYCKGKNKDHYYLGQGWQLIDPSDNENNHSLIRLADGLLFKFTLQFDFGTKYKLEQTTSK